LGLPNQGELISFLQANRGGAAYLLATTSAQSAAPIILATGQPVMAMGGFSGGDPILTSSDLADRIGSAQVRFVLLSGGGPGRADSSGAISWAQASCSPVPAELVGGSAGLYDCQPALGYRASVATETLQAAR
jgi:hypothetical protein